MHVRSADSKPHPAVLLSVNLVILLRLLKNPAWTFLGASCRPVACLFFSISWTVFFFKPRRNTFLFFFWKTSDERRGKTANPRALSLWRGAIRIRWVQIWRVVYLPDQIHGTRRGIIPVTSKKSSLSAEGKRLAALVGASFWEGKTRGSTKAQAEQRGFFF